MLEKLKIMLGIPSDDTDIDKKLSLIISNATARLTMLLGGIDPPEELDHIILEASISRYNRIGSEGMAGHTVEGESITFTDDDFAAFSEEIQVYLDSQKASTRGKVFFL